jgi:ribosome-associated protein
MSEWEIAVQAARSKKAEDTVLLKIGPASSFTDYFVICTGTNPRQVQAIADSIETTLKSEGVRPIGVEGYRTAEWVLLDYSDFVVHVFSAQSRQFYALERLWKHAARVPLPAAHDSEGVDREDRFGAVPTSN